MFKMVFDRHTTIAFTLLLWAELSCLGCHRVNAVEPDECAAIDTNCCDSANKASAEDVNTDVEPEASDANTDADTTDADTGDPGPVDDEAWVMLPEGDFLMGSEKGVPILQLIEPDSIPTIPVHEVHIRGFLMLRAEVTKDDYDRCVSEGACTFRRPLSGDELSERAARPGSSPEGFAVRREAREYCAWIGGRLPTEAEWEYAARSAGKPWDYPWGNEIPTCDMVASPFVNDSEGERLYCEGVLPLPVCSRPLGNTLQGLCDMIGGAPEWVEDLWHPNYDGAPTDGSAWVRESVSDMLMWRGGTLDTAWDRMWYMYGNTLTSYTHGFRCARTIF